MKPNAAATRGAGRICIEGECKLKIIVALQTGDEPPKIKPTDRAAAQLIIYINRQGGTLAYGVIKSTDHRHEDIELEVIQ